MGWRDDFKVTARAQYGGYCNLCRNYHIQPMPYHKFSDLLEKDMSVKEIYVMQINKKIDKLLEGNK